MDSSSSQPFHHERPPSYTERSRQRFARLLRPLQSTFGSSVESEGREPQGPEEDSEVPIGGQQPLTPAQQKTIGERIEELSQLPSPQVRELARTLASMYHMNVPKTERSSTLAPRGHHPYSEYQLRERWQELQGCCSWEGLVDPIDEVLRAEIVRYGEFAEACYDAFDNECHSKYRGSCKYTKESLLEKVGLHNRGYEITHYLYVTAENPYLKFLGSENPAKNKFWGRASSWMGFVAVCTCAEEIARLGRRDIVVAWRGTGTTFEWIQNLQDYFKPTGLDPVANQEARGTRAGPKPDEDVLVEAGFLSLYQSDNPGSRYDPRSARDQVHDAIKDLVATYAHEVPNISLTITGHSLGSALATICGYDIAQMHINRLGNNGNTSTNSDRLVQNCQPEAEGTAPLKQRTFTMGFIPVTVYCFAGPRVGNEAFKNKVKELGLAVLRVENAHDMVTKLPGKLFKGATESVRNFFKLDLHPTYQHVGVELKLDHTKSDFLKQNLYSNFIESHNLEAYLHLVDGFHGSEKKFSPNLRDYALVNKRCNFLKPKYYIPPKWWQEEYKGLRRGENGRWEVPERGDDLFPPTSPFETPGSDEHSGDLIHYVTIAVQKSVRRMTRLGIAKQLKIYREKS